jgi:hypothetical protein
VITALLALALASTPSDGAAPLRLGIVSNLVAPPDKDPELTALGVHDACAHVASFAARLIPLSRSEMLQGELDEELRDCGSDARCISARLEAAEIDLGAILVVNLAVEPPLITMRLIDTERRAVLAERATAVARGDRTLAQLVSSEFAELLERGGHPALGKLIVEAAPVEAQVKIETAPDARLSAPGAFILPPGRHRITASADDHADTSTSVLVERLRESRIAMRLEEDAAIWESPWFWAAVAGAAAAGVAAGLIVLGGEDRLTICQTRDGVAACPEPR